MLGEMITGLIVEFIPDLVWKLLFLVLGIVTTVSGTTMLNESIQTGAALIVVGVVLVVGSLFTLYREQGKRRLTVAD